VSALDIAERSPLHGDEASLFEANHAQLLKIVRAAVNASPQTIEDACAFAWVQLLRYQPERRHLMSWLVKVATREAWRLTGQEWQAAADAPALEAATSEEPTTDDRLECLEVTTALLALGREESELVLLAAAGYSYLEITEVTGRTRRAVERRLKRARAHLRQAQGLPHPARRAA